MKLFAKIGAIEISDTAVRVAVIKTGLGPPKVLESVELHVEESEGLSKRITQVATVRAAVESLDSAPAAFVLVVPATWSILRRLTVPFRGARKVAAAAPFELEPYLAIPIEELVVRFLRTGAEAGGTEVLAIGVRRESLEEQIAILEEADVPVEGAMLDGLAITSLWHGMRSEAGGIQAVLHARESGSMLAVLEGKKLAFLHRMDASADAFSNEPEAVAREIQNLLRARTAEGGAGSAPQSLTITGLTGVGEAAARFEGALRIPVQYEDLSTRFVVSDEGLPAVRGAANHAAGDDRNRWTALVAAATSAAGGGFHLSFLEQDSVSSKSREALTRYGVITCLLGVALVIGFLFSVYANHRKNVGSLERLGAAVWEEFAATYPDVAISRPDGDTGGFKSLQFMEAAAEEEREITSTLSLDMFDRPTVLDILRELGKRLPDRIAAIKDLNIAVTKRMTVTISGEIKDSEAFNAAVKDLETSTLFTIETDRLKRTFAGGKETFVITASR